VTAPRTFLILLIALAVLGRSEERARAQDVAPPPPVATPAPAPLPVSSAAERIYQSARSKLLQIRTVLAASGRQTTLGSAFLVNNAGVAITNYHVVSQFVLEPELYRLEYFTATGGHGNLQLLAFDLANDLAAVRIDQPQPDYFTFDPRPLEELTKGEQLYAMGNPLDIGFAIVEGTYNGLVERSYTPRIHFSGAVNPGMSGGPAVAADGGVVGINVATRLGGELVSFLVPARYATALFASAAQRDPPAPASLRAEVGRQIAARQAALYRTLAAGGFQQASFGPYSAPESKADWFTCWGQTNAEQVPKPRAAVETTSCTSDSDVYIANDLSVGRLAITHSYIRSVDLNAFQFASFLAQQNGVQWAGGWRQKWYTVPRCTQDYTLAAPPAQSPPVEAVWCARAYKDFTDLYDIAVASVTQDRNQEALVSRLSLQAVTYEDAVSLSKQFFEALQWQK
jgi:S1-C subfamily serine protease